ncbi:MAG: hypothetical protein IKJ42_09060 [Bacteroidaceae bacterium]|nr:hypothetical protein [Bacteroidaceae bacterium]
MKQFNFLPLWMFAAALCLTACSDDEENEMPVDEELEEGISADKMNYERILSQICTVDTTTGIPVYAPLVGEAIMSVTPDIYYVGVESEDEARNLFYSYFIPSGAEESVVENADGTLTFGVGEYGNVHYTPGNGSQDWGMVEVNLAALTNFTNLVFIPKAKWPDNVSSQFYVGDVIYQKSKNRWWICVRACEGGQQGILMTWDGGTTRTGRSDHYKSYTKVTGCASRGAWNALAQFYYSDKEAFNAMYDELLAKKDAKNSTFLKGSKLLTGAFDNLRFPNNWSYETFQVGDMWDNNYFWMGFFKWRNVWEGSTDYVKLSLTWENNMPRFQSGNYYFKRDYSPTVPDDRDGHSMTFSSWTDMSGYERKYPIY